ncbi:unnamed protein product [Amoebophrya sp. A120]|nr:unnamed protein product [Amoebophrya sp. A120]|eukprot:GSA120T00016659001.1
MQSRGDGSTPEKLSSSSAPSEVFLTKLAQKVEKLETKLQLLLQERKMEEMEQTFLQPQVENEKLQAGREPNSRLPSPAMRQHKKDEAALEARGATGRINMGAPTEDNGNQEARAREDSLEDHSAISRTQSLALALRENTTAAFERIRDVGATNEYVLELVVAFLFGWMRSQALFSTVFVCLAYLAAVSITLLPARLVLCPRRFPTREHAEKMRKRGLGHLLNGVEEEEFYLLPWNFYEHGTLSSVCQVQSSPEGIIFTSGLLMFGVFVILSRYTFELHSPWCFLKHSLVTDLGTGFTVTQSYLEMSLRLLLLVVPASGFILTACLPSVSFDHDEITPLPAANSSSRAKEADKAGESVDEEERARISAPRAQQIELQAEATRMSLQQSQKYLSIGHGAFVVLAMFLMLVFETVQLVFGEGVSVSYVFRFFEDPTPHDPLLAKRVEDMAQFHALSTMDSCQRREVCVAYYFEPFLAARMLTLLFGWVSASLFVVLKSCVNFRQGQMSEKRSGPLVPVTVSLFWPSLVFVLEVLAMYTVFLLPVLKAMELFCSYSTRTAPSALAPTSSEYATTQAQVLQPDYTIGNLVFGLFSEARAFWWVDHASAEGGPVEQACGTFWDTVLGDQGRCPTGGSTGIKFGDVWFHRDT